MQTIEAKQTSNGGAKRRHHDEQFKREAVAQLNSGRKASQLVRELAPNHLLKRPIAQRANPTFRVLIFEERSASRSTLAA